MSLRYQWTGLRGNLQENPIFNGKIDGFRLRFSLKPIHWRYEIWVCLIRVCVQIVIRIGKMRRQTNGFGIPHLSKFENEPKSFQTIFLGKRGSLSCVSKFPYDNWWQLHFWGCPPLSEPRWQTSDTPQAQAMPQSSTNTWNLGPWLARTPYTPGSKSDKPGNPRTKWIQMEV